MGQKRSEMEAEANKLEALGTASELYYYMRPEMANAILNMMNQGGSLFNPMNNAMGQMYGPQAQSDLGATMKNPFSNRYYEIGRPSGATEASIMENDPKLMRQGAERNGVFRPLPPPKQGGK